MNKIGNGCDIHQLAEGYRLIIGGIHIPFEKGSKGHSDGDVLIHAIVDALLGAVAEGDIGAHFPSNDDKWKNADSRIFLEHAHKIVTKKGFQISNLDCTIILQTPKLSTFISKIRKNISEILDLSLDNISIKATTTDYLGFIGRGEGIASLATCLLNRNK
ncbi:MAG: 2-C-methyl-D-erythritol 2,4-cyclodiphosphate synthase [Candidatus Marinimicrobia bacterium]|nr:2-C-methyl-D-erythritol 2,4-cyclodiphosphate synthase [Candidatus Neomarinimicrobiota bacterium]MBL7108984.1 2-C-methyl-D-erythritol 2,4-cyclodiphosphate synthase [Candidatus Neomarinimicrobiota bacterium]